MNIIEEKIKISTKFNKNTLITSQNINNFKNDSKLNFSQNVKKRILSVKKIYYTLKIYLFNHRFYKK